jgi:transposase
MANKTIVMSKLRQILYLYSQGESNVKISKLSGVSRNTLKKYLKRFKELMLTKKDIIQFSDEQLDELFGSFVIVEPNERYKQLEVLFPTIEKELKKKGMTRKKLWQDYIKACPEGYGISQFKDLYNKWLQRSKPIMHIEHKAGDKMYIDFAGEKLRIVDAITGEIQMVEVFIAVLGASQLTYIEAARSQRKEDLIACCENALHYFGGVPMAIVPDNLKSAVKKSDKYEPTLNEAFESFAQHYNTAILPARAYKPKDKSLVEGGVKIAYMRIYTLLRDHVWYALEELNKAIWQALEVHNQTPFNHRPYSRRQLFEEIEKEALNPLPAMRYEIKKQQIATVAKNCHICLREDKHYYSVPYQHIGKKVKVLYGDSQVNIYYRYRLIAQHERDRKPYRYTTVVDHLASNHRFQSDWNPDKFIIWAGGIAEPVKELVIMILDKAQHPEQAYKSCIGILSYERKVGRDRLINACKRALEYQQYSYSIVRNILERGLDLIEEEEVEEVPDVIHENIRGKQYYS